MPGPLAGLKVLDFSTLLPGPFATLALADLGAEVLRITAPGRPDLNDLLGPLLAPGGPSAVAAYLGRGKRSLSLDLKHPQGPVVVRRLLASHDVLVEQFRPGVMQRLGLGYRDLAAEFPGLIYCSLTGYGQDGPLRDRAGHDINYLSRSGLMSYSGRRETGPTLSGMQIADLAAGSWPTVIAILAAVVHRQAGGQGQHLDVSMADGSLAFNAMAGAACLAGDGEPGREGHLLNGGSLYDFYRCKDGGYISFGGLEPKFAAAFLTALGRPDLAGQGVLPADLPRVKEEIRAIIATRTRDEWVAHFKDVDACVEPVLGLEEALDSEPVRARGLVRQVALPGGGTVRQLGFPVAFSATPAEPGPAGVTSGTHSDEVMAELGYAPEEVARLRADGLFG